MHSLPYHAQQLQPPHPYLAHYTLRPGMGNAVTFVNKPSANRGRGNEFDFRFEYEVRVGHRPTYRAIENTYLRLWCLSLGWNNLHRLYLFGNKRGADLYQCQQSSSARAATDPSLLCMSVKYGIPPRAYTITTTTLVERPIAKYQYE